MHRIFLRTLYEIGGSIGVTIPALFKNNKYLVHGSRVIVTVEEDRVIIETINEKSLERLKEVGLEQLLHRGNKDQIIISETSKQRTIGKNLRKGAKIK